MTAIARRFRSDERGSTTLEYGLIASLIGVAIIVGAFALAGTISSAYGDTPPAATMSVTVTEGE